MENVSMKTKLYWTVQRLVDFTFKELWILKILIVFRIKKIHFLKTLEQGRRPHPATRWEPLVRGGNQFKHS